MMNFKGMGLCVAQFLLCFLFTGPLSLVSALQGVCNCYNGYSLSLLNPECTEYCSIKDSKKVDSARKYNQYGYQYAPSMSFYHGDDVPRFRSRGKRSYFNRFSCRCCEVTGDRTCCNVCVEETSYGYGDMGIMKKRSPEIIASECCRLTGNRACCYYPGNIVSYAKRSNVQAIRLGSDMKKRGNKQAALMGHRYNWLTKRSNRQAALMDYGWYNKRSNRQAVMMDHDWFNKRSNRQAVMMDHDWFNKRSNRQAGMMDYDWFNKRGNRQGALMDYDWVSKRSNRQAALMGYWLNPEHNYLSKRSNLKAARMDICCRFGLNCCENDSSAFYSPYWYKKK